MWTRDISLPAWRKITMKKILIATFALLTALVMGLGATAIAVSPARNPVSEEVEASIKEGESALEKNDSAPVEKSGESITAIGDSVMLGAAGALQDEIDGITVDAKESRQVRAAKEIAADMKKNGTLGDTVIIALGTNGTFNQATGQALLDEIGHDRHIYWVLTYGKDLSWMQDVNATINDLAENNSNVRLIDWPAAATANPDWLYGDGIHLNPTGQKGYAKMIRDAVL